MTLNKAFRRPPKPYVRPPHSYPAYQEAIRLEIERIHDMMDAMERGNRYLLYGLGYLVMVIIASGVMIYAHS